MKKIIIVFASIVALGFMAASCSKDYGELIVGKWIMQSIEDTSILDTVIHDEDWGWVFNTDGTGYSYDISNGTEQTITELTYSVIEDSLHIKYSSNYKLDFYIEQITNRKLRLSNRVEKTDIAGNPTGYGYSYWYLKKK